MRINKYLAHAGVCSRRDADKLIERGEVLVNGTLPVPGQTVDDADEIVVEGKRLRRAERPVVLAFYKPVGVTCTERDEHAETTVSELVQYPVRVTYAGRLDKDSEGLLLLTNDGDLIQGMMRGANRHEKEYLVRVKKEITPDFLSKMEKGVFLKDLGVKTRPCKVKKVDPFTFRITLTQGLNRQIKRMCLACGAQVKSIKRTRVMHVTLEGLKPGEYRELPSKDVEKLYRDCGIQKERDR